MTHAPGQAAAAAWPRIARHIGQPSLRAAVRLVRDTRAEWVEQGWPAPAANQLARATVLKNAGMPLEHATRRALRRCASLTQGD